LLIHEVYKSLHTYGFVESQYDYDRTYLQRPVGHYAYLKATGTDATTDTLLRLYFSLESELKQLPEEDDSRSVVDRLADEVWTEMRAIGSLNQNSVDVN
jgi:hypothetical protein